jgi:acetoin utilization deacetylase AcuC-like enzyme
VAETHSEGRIVSVLEGGYNVPILAGCVEAHLRAL